MITDSSRLAERARHRRFHSLVSQVVKTLPDDVQTMLENVAIVVENEPSDDHLRDGNGTSEDLFGLYQGIPRTDRGSGYSIVTPDRITIFSGPLTRACSSRLELHDQIRITVLHELGHHLGFDEDGLDSMGLS